MASFYTSTEVEVDVNIQLNPRDIYDNLDSDELTELLRLIQNGRNTKNKDYSISDMVSGMTDVQILTDKNVLDYIIRLLKYDTPEMLEYVVEELKY